MNSLDKRITALEATAQGPNSIDIILRFIMPGNLEPDINRVYDHHGGEWLRQPGETAQELEDQAIAEARLTTKGMLQLIAEEYHAETLAPNSRAESQVSRGVVQVCVRANSGN